MPVCRRDRRQLPQRRHREGVGEQVERIVIGNRQRTTMKLLHAEDGGLVLYIKRLEEGTFRIPS